MTTNNHPAHGPVSLDRLHQISEILRKAAAQSDGGNLGYAMADAVKVIDVAIAAFGAEHNYDIHRDANRYRFLRDKDAFGDEGAPGLASWDDLAELDMGDFDSAVDARLLSCEMPQHILTEAQERTATAGVYAELYRLREEVKGPDGFDTWKDAAIAERKARVELEKAVPILSDIDYLGAMAAFHSDEWHKMGPITGYMHGWNACRAAMLQAGNSPSQCSLRDGIETIRNSGIPVDVDKIQSESEAGKSPVTPDCWIPVSERMPERDVDVQVYCADKKEQMVGYMERNETEGWFRFASLPNGGGVYCKPTHWMPLPAEPKQEVKNV